MKAGSGYEPGAVFECGRQVSGYRGVADIIGARGRAAFRVTGCGAVDPVLADVGPVRLWYYGLAYAVGLLTVDLWVWLKRERLGFEGRDVAGLSVFFAAGVLLGGRLFDVVLYEWFYYESHIWQVPDLWQGGMATHGVLLGAVMGSLLFCRLSGKSFLAVADEIVLPGAVLLALGRIGNHINGEVYGSVTNVSWAMEFPFAEGCRHPVALYDGLKNLQLVPILLGVRSIKLRRSGYLPRGLMLGHFVLWYGLLRMLVDFFRDYDSYWFGIGRGQYFNLVMAMVGLCSVAVALARAESWAVRRSAGMRDPAFWCKKVAFYALVALCLTIPSGWTQQVLDEFQARRDVASQVVTICGSERSYLTRKGRPSASGAQ
jgi:phosphatidylglycerol:prolipoprotein diacylglycerol transferase